MADFKSVGSDTLSEVGGTAKTMVKSAAQEVGNVVGGAFGQIAGSMLSPEQQAQKAEAKVQIKQQEKVRIAQLRSQLSSLRGRGTEPQRINLSPKPTSPEIRQSKPVKELPKIVDPRTKNQAEITGSRSSG